MLLHARKGGAGTARRRPQFAGAASASAVALILALGLSSHATAAPPHLPASATLATAVPAGQSCAWPSLINVQTSNVGAPDSAASYWAEPIVADTDTQVTVFGRYPDARFASLSVYTPSGSAFSSNGVGNTLTDYQIAPDFGSINPWRQHAAPGGRFTVSIRSHVSAHQHNTLPMPPGTTAQAPGYLLYRVYAPANGDFARVTPPTLVVRQGHTSRTLLPCRVHNGPVPTPVPAPTATASSTSTPVPIPPELEFYKPSAALTNATFPNGDTAYAMAHLLRPPASDVVVVTAKAPVAAPGEHPSRWPAPGEDMRYWSMCVVEGTLQLPTVDNPLPNGQDDFGCRKDDTTRRDAAGDYAYVIGAESQRAAIEGIPGVTFLPFATDQASPRYLLVLRNMLLGPQFTDAVQDGTGTPSNDPAAAAAAMGPYYPHAAVCPLALLATQGIHACAATTSPPTSK